MDPGARVRLGRGGLEATRLGLGTAPIGGLYEPVNDGQAAATIERAWERGVRLVDTAPFYGHGLSERRAGRALAGRPRDELILSTKVGRLLVPGATGDLDPAWADPPTEVLPRFDFSYEAVHQSLASSLDRLGMDRVDVLLLHDPDDHYDQALGDGYRALDELRAAGTVGAVGAGMNQSAMLTRLVREAPPPGPDCVLLAGRYTLLDQSGLADLLPACVEHDVGVIIGGVYNSGLLADPRPGARYNYAVAPQAMLDRALALQRVCDRHGVPLRAAAIQFPLAHPAIRTVLVGARSPEEVDDAVAMFDHPVPGALWADLRAAGLLGEEVPTP
jgi:D-threo-aldose 1-dehydrogenase